MKTRETMRTREEINSPMLMEREAAKYLRINNSTLADLRKYGFINSLDLGARKYPKWELDRFISKWTDSQESIEDALEQAKREHEVKDEKIVHLQEMNNVWPYLVILGCFAFAAIYSIGIRHEQVFQKKYRGKHNRKRMFR